MTKLGATLPGMLDVVRGQAIFLKSVIKKRIDDQPSM